MYELESLRVEGEKGEMENGVWKPEDGQNTTLTISAI